MNEFLNITKALTDENRLRVLMALRDGELCVCQITGFLDLAPSTTSKHLSILRQAGLIDSRKKGKWVYYSVPEIQNQRPVVAEALRWIRDSLADSPVIRDDERRIRELIEREENFCPASERGQDSFHSLEIHSLAAAEDERDGGGGFKSAGTPAGSRSDGSAA